MKSNSPMMRVRDWDSRFENNRTRDLRIMRWVPVDADLSSDLYATIMDDEDGPARFGAYVAVIILASKGKPRGYLRRADGTPHDAASIARVLRMKKDLIESVIQLLLDVGEIEYEKRKASRSNGSAPHDAAEMSRQCAEITHDAAGKLPLKEEKEEKEENRSEEKRDLDFAPTNRKKRDSQPRNRETLPHKPSQPKKYPQLAQALASYFNLPGEEVIEPSDRQVVDVVEAAGGASETEIIEKLKFLYNVRGLVPGTKGGPRHYAWFPTVIQDCFTKRETRYEAANPCGYSEWEDRNDRMDAQRVSEIASVFDAASEASAPSESKPRSQGLRSAADLLAADGYPGRRGRGAA